MSQRYEEDMVGPTQMWGRRRSLSSTASWGEVNRQPRTRARSVSPTVSFAVSEVEEPPAVRSPQDHPHRPPSPDRAAGAVPKARQHQRARRAGSASFRPSQQQQAESSNGENCNHGGPGKPRKGYKPGTAKNVPPLRDRNSGHYVDHSLITQDYVGQTHTKEALEHTARVAFCAEENRD